MAQGHLFIISAPTGAGKTTLARAIIKKLENTVHLERVITYTTRPQRTSEHPNIDYHFISPEAFSEKQKNNFFLETTNYNSFWYGSPNSIKTDIGAGKQLLLITDRHGAKSIKNIIPSALLIWITVSDIAVITERLCKRNTEHSETLKQRIALAEQEIHSEENEPLFAYHVINQNLDAALNELERIIVVESAK